MKLWIAVILFVIVSAVVLGIWAHQEDMEHDGFAFVYRSKYFSVDGDGCDLLDQKLGTGSRSPTRLLEVLQWLYDEDASKNPHGLGYPEFFDAQHQALVRLLALQESEFGKEPPAQHWETLRADHTGVRFISSQNGVHLIEGSASVYPDEFDQHPWEGYYLWERFHFDGTGRLLDRSPIKQ